MSKTIPADVMSVLKQCKYEGNRLFLPPTNLERTLYTNTNKIIESRGGKWNRGAKAHIFPDGVDAAAAMDQVVATGKFTDTKKELQQFDTPGPLAAKLVDLANIIEGDTFLEPSAGNGAIITAILAEAAKAKVWAIEIDQLRCNRIQSIGIGDGHVIQGDFLHFEPGGINGWPEQFDRIIMNPPFAKNQDIDHVLHAFKFLKPGGRIVAITSPHFTFATEKKVVAFKKFLEQHNAFWEDVKEGTFKESGTNVRTVIVTIDKPLL